MGLSWRSFATSFELAVAGATTVVSLLAASTVVGDGPAARRIRMRVAMSDQSLTAAAIGRTTPGSEQRATPSPSGLHGAALRPWLDRPPIVGLVLFFAAYLLACAFARKMQIVPGHTTAFWPAAGIFVATLLSTRRGTWAWYVLAGLAAEMSANVLWFRNGLPAALGFYVANALEALTAAWLLSRFVASPFHLRTPREVIGLFVLGAGLAPIIGATVGSMTHHIVGQRTFSSAWGLWWLGDASGLLTTLPLALAALQLWQARAEIPIGRLVEATVTGVALLGTAWLAVEGYLPTLYATLLPLLWAALLPGSRIASGVSSAMHRIASSSL